MPATQQARSIDPEGAPAHATEALDIIIIIIIIGKARKKAQQLGALPSEPPEGAPHTTSIRRHFSPVASARAPRPIKGREANKGLSGSRGGFLACHLAADVDTEAKRPRGTLYY